MAYWLERQSAMKEAQVRILDVAFFIFSFLPEFSSKSLKATGFCSILTVKTAPENSRPYTFCNATLRTVHMKNKYLI